jgi:FAD synthase
LVSFAHRLREERRFDTPALLVEQLKKDVQMVDEQFDKDIEE